MTNLLLKLDDIDRNILVILQENSKITNASLATRVGLSPAPTLERVKKLEKSGLILKYHAELNKEILGLNVCIFLTASLSASRRDKMESFVAKIDAIPEVVECHHITGSADFILKVLTNDIQSYNKFILEKLINLDEIANLQSMVVLSTLKDSKILPVK